ncbi:MAG: cation-transporting P-type ATPase [Dehalococcoidales bacterium]|nr:cation-transporting P-type ATPase [Dehalococcoidales bacterium]
MGARDILRLAKQNAQASLETSALATVPECLRLLGTEPEGLTSEEAALRLEEFGPNAIAGEERSILTILLEQFQNGLVIMLFAAGLITVALGDFIDGAIILALLLLNTSLGFLQEYRSERALADLRRMVEVLAPAVRDSREVKIPARNLVPGDVVLVRAGDIVPADMRLIEGASLMVNQAALTGESLWQEKDPAPLATLPAMFAAATNLLFSGTSVMAGAGKAVVIGTGSRTAFGSAASLLQDIRRVSDFQRNLSRFGGFLLRFGLLLTALIFVANALLGRSIITSLTLSLALAIGMVPEALPAVTITALSLGAAALARKKVVVRRLASVEDFSAIDILCTDKTGTITQNKIAVTGLWSDAGDAELLRAAVLCSGFPARGENPIDDAVIEQARKRGLGLDDLAEIHRPITIPFTSDRKRMSVVVVNEVEGREECELITKGAARVVLQRCSRVRRRPRSVDIGPEQEALAQRVRAAEEAGNSVLAVASRPLSSCRDIAEADEQGLTLLGFILLADPLRPSVGDALNEARSLGLDVKIITGDSRYTAIVLAKSLGLPAGPGEVVTGEELQAGRDIAEAAERAHIFAEVVPEDKYRIVRALQAKGHRVAVTGDGINDAPALKTADVGIAMQSGTDVAKDASDLILLENELGVIVDGLREGRRIFINLNRYLLYTMVSNFANVLIVAVASLLLDFLPLLPAQVLLLSILPDLPMLAIATDRVSPRQVARPQRWDIRQIVEPAIYLGIVNALFAFALLRFLRNAPPPELRSAWYLFLVVTAILVLFPVRSRGPFWQGASPSWEVLVATFAGLFAGIVLAGFPLSQTVFGFVSLPVPTQLAIFGYSILYVLFAEFLLLAYRRHTGEPQSAIRFW